MTRMQLSYCMQRGPPSGTDCFKHWRKRNPGRATPSGANASASVAVRVANSRGYPPSRLRHAGRERGCLSRRCLPAGRTSHDERAPSESNATPAGLPIAGARNDLRDTAIRVKRTSGRLRGHHGQASCAPLRVGRPAGREPRRASSEATLLSGPSAASAVIPASASTRAAVGTDNDSERAVTGKRRPDSWDSVQGTRTGPWQRCRPDISGCIPAHGWPWRESFRSASHPSRARF